MRALLVLKQISFLVLLSLVANLVLPSMQLAMAGDDDSAGEEDLVIATIIKSRQAKKITPEHISEKAKEIRGELLALPKEDLIDVLDKSAVRVLAYFSAADALMALPKDSAFRFSEGEAASLAIEKNQKKEKVVNQLIGIAQSVPRTDVPTPVKTRTKVGGVAVVVFSAFLSLFLFANTQVLKDKALGMRALSFVLDISTPGSDIDELVEMQENRNTFEYKFKRKFHPTSSETFPTVAKEAIWESLPTRAMLNGTPEDLRNGNLNGTPEDELFNQRLVQYDLKKVQERKATDQSFAYEKEAMEYEALAYSSVLPLSAALGIALALLLFVPRSERKSYEKQKANEPLYEKHFWGVLRARFADVPADHNAAVEWLAAKIQTVNAALVSGEAPHSAKTDRVRVVGEKACKTPLVDPNFEAQDEALAEDEAQPESKPTAARSGMHF